MARRKTYRRVSSRVGGFKSMIAPLAAGVADNYADNMLPVQGAGATVVGIFMKNNTVRDIGLYKIGQSLGNIIPIPGLNAGGSNEGVL